MTLSEILITLASILHHLISLYIWIIFLEVLLSLFFPLSPLRKILHNLTKQLFDVLRKRLRLVYKNRFDFTPIFVILALQFIDMTLVKGLNAYARSL